MNNNTSFQNNKKYLTKIHKDLLEITKFSISLFEELNLEYYIAYGTLLGAVRHKGFIPWDDDVDFWMPRNDYNKLINYSTKNNLGMYTLYSKETHNFFTQPHLKIARNNTSFVENMRYEKQDVGIFIDVFPLDNVTKITKLLKYKAFFNKYMLRIYTHKKINIRPKHPTRWKNNIENILYTVLPFKILKKISLYKRNKLNNKPLKYITCYTTINNVKDTFLYNKIYSKDTLLEFEDLQVKVPKHYEYILKQIYGNSYMQLPQKNDRFNHTPEYVKFIDGSTMTFTSKK